MKRSISFVALLAALSVIVLVLAPGADAASKPPNHEALVVDNHRGEGSIPAANKRVSSETGAPLALYRVGYQVNPAEPEDMARQYLGDHASQLHLKDPELDDLLLHASRETLAGSTARFRQHYRGVPVYRAEIAVSMDRDSRVQFVASSYKPRLDLENVDANLTAAQARQIALLHLGVRGRLELDRAALNVYYDGGETRLVYKIDLLPIGTPQGEWEVLVDAKTGELVRSRDVAYYTVGGSNGDGDVFLPDPLSSALATYGDPGFVDGADADTPQLLGEISNVTLLDLTNDVGICGAATPWCLTGPWAECLDWDLPFSGCFPQATGSFVFTRFEDGFEAANGYYHIDTYMRYLNLTLGLAITPIQYPTGVRYDPNGFSGADNSSYSSGTGRLRFGEGGVDDAEDADVLIHELGHGLHDWATNGALSQTEGLSEGVGDFAAVAYSRAFSQWTPADPQFNWVFSWDGHNPFWNGRVTNWNDTNTYPDDLGGSIHTNGQFWASCNIDIYEQIGRDLSEAAHWEGLKMTTFNTNQQDAAQAVLQAATNMGYSGFDIATMEAIYSGCGYAITTTSIFADGFESGNTTLWDQAVP